MKIYGQSLREIFDKLPWQYKIVVVAGSLFVVFVVIDVPLRILSGGFAARAPVPAPLVIPGTEKQASGMLDPSLAYDPQNKTVWLAYTSQENPPEKAPGAKMLHVRLASASDARGCKDWSQSANGFEGKNDDILAPDGLTVLRSGAWRVETPTLVHDPDDHGREWKLYAYKYFWANDPASALQIAQHYGIIVYKYASDPAKEWSTEQWLFSPAPEYPPAPYESMILLHLNRLDPDLQKMVGYSRPSALYRDGALTMTLSAFTGEATPDRIVMIVSLDHGNSWRYVGAPLQKSDLAGISAASGNNSDPYTVLAGATLIEQEGRVYLAAVLGDKLQRGKGTFIFEFEDFAKGLLRRDPQTGAPVVLHQVPLLNPTAGMIGGGFAAYNDACNFGLLTTEQTSFMTDFRIFKTYVTPVEKTPAKP